VERRTFMLKKLIQVSLVGLVIVLMGCAPTNKSGEGTVQETDTDQTVVEALPDTKEESKSGSEENSTEESDPPTEEGSASSEATSNDSQEELQKYIDVELVDKDGNPAKISDYEGKFIALNFFGVWCRYCMEEMPDLEAFYSEYEGDDFVILLVNATTTENIGKEGVKKWYEEGGYTMPMIMDLEGEALEIYPVSGFPTTYFINKEGFILGAIPGMLTKDMLQTIVDTYNK
jgi:cytochrome c-type biogenesis protein